MICWRLNDPLTDFVGNHPKLLWPKLKKSKLFAKKYFLPKKICCQKITHHIVGASSAEVNWLTQQKVIAFHKLFCQVATPCLVLSQSSRQYQIYPKYNKGACKGANIDFRIKSTYKKPWTLYNPRKWNKRNLEVCKMTYA